MKNSVKKKVSKNPNFNKNLLIGVVILILIFVVAFNFAGKDSDEEGLAQRSPNLAPGAPSKPGGGSEPCQQVGEACGGMDGECCSKASARNTNYNGLPLMCAPHELGSVCIPRCTSTKIGRPVECHTSAFLDENDEKIEWQFNCCPENSICTLYPLSIPDKYKCKAVCASGSIKCGITTCCNIRDGPDPDNLPDNVCRFYPNEGPSGTYKCEENDIKPCDPNKPEKCKQEGNYYCRTDPATDECEDGYDRCCFAHETCVQDKEFPLGICMQTGATFCKKNGVYSHICSAGGTCCGDTCCSYDQQCTSENGRQVCKNI